MKMHKHCNLATVFHLQAEWNPEAQLNAGAAHDAAAGIFVPTGLPPFEQITHTKQSYANLWNSPACD